MRSALHKVVVILAVCALQITASAQSTPVVLSARAYGMGDAGTALQDINAAFYNPAGIAHIDGWAAQVVASRRFELSELTQISAAAGKSLSENDVIYGGIRRFGFSAYNESSISFGYARSLSAELSVGVQFDVYQYRIEDYGTTRAFGYTIALQQEVTKGVILGVRALNPVVASEPEGTRIPSVFNLGGSIALSDQVTLAGELEKDADYEARVKVGLEYELSTAFVVRAGASSSPSIFHGGVGFRLDNGLIIDLAAGYHQILGITPVLGVTYVPG